jgi:hypothetical protein
MAKGINAVNAILIGVGAAIVAPAVLPVAAAIIRPFSKMAIKGGILLFDKAREKGAEAKEFFEDVTAEAKMETGKNYQQNSTPEEQHQAAAAC